MSSHFYIIKLKDGRTTVKEVKDNPKLGWATEYYCLTSPAVESYKKIQGVDCTQETEQMQKICERYLFSI